MLMLRRRTNRRRRDQREETSEALRLKIKTANKKGGERKRKQQLMNNFGGVGRMREGKRSNEAVTNKLRQECR